MKIRDSINSFLCMFGMTVSFYGLKYILGLFMERFSGEFPTRLFLVYSVMAVATGVVFFLIRKNIQKVFVLSEEQGEGYRKWFLRRCTLRMSRF